MEPLGSMHAGLKTPCTMPLCPPCASSWPLCPQPAAMSCRRLLLGHLVGHPQPATPFMLNAVMSVNQLQSAFGAWTAWPPVCTPQPATGGEGCLHIGSSWSERLGLLCCAGHNGGCTDHAVGQPASSVCAWCSSSSPRQPSRKSTSQDA